MNKIEKCSISQKGRIVIHKDDVEKRVFPEDLQQYLDQGYVKGPKESHKRNNGEKHKGSTPWNKGTKGVMKPNKTTFQKGSTPWNKGLRGAQTSWNKGLTKETDERLQKTSANLVKAWENNDERRKAQAERMHQNAGKKLTKEQLEHFLAACEETHRKNNSFNTSTAEDKYYIQLCEQYGEADVIRQYRDKQRYPFRADFYIKSLDLFIEVNLHWTHGERPFNPEDEACIKQLNDWKEKAKTSQYFANAIYVWTELDVKKQRIAKENNLNYIVIYD